MLTNEPAMAQDTVRSMSREATGELLQRVAGRIAPVWPLADMVAVNPYLGLADLQFADAVELLEQVGGLRSTPSVDDARGRLDSGDIDAVALAEALAIHRPDLEGDTDRFIEELDADPRGTPPVVPLRCDLVDVHGYSSASSLMVERISSWASAWFDEGQSTWSSVDRRGGLFRSWRAEADIDRTTEVLGLRGFRAAVASFPEDHVDAASSILTATGLPGPDVERYLHALALRVGGWASVCARVDWDARRNGEDDTDTVAQFLALLLCWDTAGALVGGPAGSSKRWRAAVLAATEQGNRQAPHGVVLQEASDHSAQRRLVEQLGSAGDEVPTAPARATAVCCIDVRSEVLRRSLESVAPDVSTAGFAGFFGMPVEVRPIGHDRAVPQCPPLVTPAVVLDERAEDDHRSSEAADTRRYLHHLHRAWKQFKTGAVSCFGFVSPLGLLFAPKLFTDAFGLTRPVRHPATEGLPRWAERSRTPAGTESLSAMPLPTKVDLAAGALRAMSLGGTTAPVVALVGHGSTSVNNPQSAGLECGACGGHSGSANARIAAALLNDPAVRSGVRERGVALSGSTLFVAALHDTTTDVVTVLDRESVPPERAGEVQQLQDDLSRAGVLARRERAPRLGLDAGADPLPELQRRTRDWAQTRPEWGLAGCRAFVAAPRSRTRGIDLRGQVFLHEYDPGLDPTGAVLEQIMTAPMVVASWITLQYYASTVDPSVYGSGDKTLHNVVGRMGVLEGSGGDVRIGLSRQSVRDGSSAQHDPLRLHVVIEASTQSIDAVIARQASVADLLDNGWVHLHAIDPATQRWSRYDGSTRWNPVR